MTDTIPSAPRIKRREVWVDLPAEYEGLKARIWVNVPARIWADIGGSEKDAAKAAARQVVLEHNGWLDFDGEPYPPASDDAFWDVIPTELAAVLLTVIQLEMAKLPNSLTPRRRR
jgi:hypothetical protein